MKFRNFSHVTVRLLAGFFLVFTLLLAGCGGGGSNGATSTATLTTITVTPLSATIPIGTTVALTAKGLYSDKTTADITTKVTWSSAASSVASVGSGTGVVSGVSVGTAIITAALNGQTAQASITVTATGGGVPLKHLATGRYEQTANLVTVGGQEAVLVAGGYGANGALKSVELYDPSTDTWSATSSLSWPRGDHTSTQLTNGQVLVIGGANPPIENNYASTELYVPSVGWLPADNMHEGRSYHTSTLLTDGKVLVTGGEGANGVLKSAELYDPIVDNGLNKGTWTTVGSLNTARNQHTATVLPDGKVLVVGGYGGVVLPSPGVVPSSGVSYSSAELYDPISRAWTPTGSLHSGRYCHTATLLPNGKVLVVGGYDVQIIGGNSIDIAVTYAELYDPATGSWTKTGGLVTPRALHSATLMNDGKILVLGGEVSSATSEKTAIKSAEVYDPLTDTWRSVADLITARDLFTATLLSTGKVVVVGGTEDSNSSLIFDNSELYW
jgi:N-acetylneuraminic acid mutarotase